MTRTIPPLLEVLDTLAQEGRVESGTAAAIADDLRQFGFTVNRLRPDGTWERINPSQFWRAPDQRT